MSNKTKREIRCGFVGCGKHATSNILPSLRLTKAHLVAVCDLNGNLAKRVARNFGADHWYTDYSKMLKKETLDVLFTVIGPKQHYEIAKKTMRDYHLHIFTEKPPSENEKQSKELYEISKKMNCHLTTGFMKRFSTSNALLKETIELPEFGTPQQYEARFTSYFKYPPYNNERYFLLDYVTHYTDLTRFFMGNVKNLIAKKIVKGKVFLGYQILFEFKDSRTGVLTMNALETWGHPNERVAIVGENGNLAISENGRYRWYRNAPIRGHINYPLMGRVFEPGLNKKRDALTWEPNFTFSPMYSYKGYEVEVYKFIDSILHGKKPVPDAYGAWQAMRIMEAIQVSADKQKVIKL